VNPRVSVVIPAYNAGAFLPAALASALSQSVSPLEVIVVDDGSTDDTPDIVRRAGPSVRYLRHDRRGVAEARNRGIRESAGDWVALLDADDVWQPTKLARQLDALGRTPGASACHTAFAVVDGQGRKLSVVRRGPEPPTAEGLLMRGNRIGTPSTVICDRGVLLEAGGFDPSLSQCADWDLWIRLATRTTFAYVDEPQVAWRRHEGNMSRDVELLERDSVRVIEKLATGGLRRAALASNYVVLAGSYFHAGRVRAAIRCALRAVRLDARQIVPLAAFPYRLVGRRIGVRAGPRHVTG
jgi:glycosyltransferase involved in cell wall biosynthesis